MRLLLWVILGFSLAAADWPRFRGPEGSGVGASSGLPVEFSPQQNVVWKTPLPPGKSSPILVGERIFLTGHEGDKLLTLALDRSTGKILWRREIARARQEHRNKLNDPAAPTPASDGKRVYVFFSDFGLAAYTVEGQEVWRVPLGPFQSMQGMAASPVVAGGRVILVCDQTKDSFVAAFDAASGKELWRASRSPAPGGAYSTPIVWRGQLVTPGPFELAAYDAESGKRVWWASGLPFQPMASPVAAGARIVCAVEAAGGDAPMELETWEQVLKLMDKNGDGKVAGAEATGVYRGAFSALDGNSDGFYDQEEHEAARAALRIPSALLIVEPQGAGDQQERVRWRLEKGVPKVSSPLVYDGVLYSVRNGGIFASIDLGSGKVLQQARLTGALGNYYASPVAADGKIYAASQEGKVAVVKAGAEWEVLTVNDLGEEVFATPALDGNRMYWRTQGHLYCFGRRP
jgi:outer membrane protein assembly factor BamB